MKESPQMRAFCWHVGAEALRLAIAEGRFGEKRMRLAVAWRAQYLQQQGAAGMAADQGLTKRSVEAAEAQADIAGKSLHLSKIALVISIIALVLSVVVLLVDSASRKTASLPVADFMA